MSTKQLTITLIILIAIGLILFGTQTFLKKSDYVPVTNNPSDNAVACTMDAKMCPDGSYVGRVAPNCDFAQCPVITTGNPSGEYEVGFNQRAGGGTLSIIPLQIVEDSRCPANVQCIQAGTVRVRSSIALKGATTTEIFKLNTPMNFTLASGKSIAVTLTGVKPEKISTTTIATSSYRFTFSFAP